MSDDIQPALTPEEWAAARGEQDWQREMGVDPPMHDAVASAAAALCNIPVAPKRRRHALAALALDGQPFGFTREDVALVCRAAVFLRDDVQRYRDAHPEIPQEGETLQDAWADDLTALADRIAALLPRE